MGDSQDFSMDSQDFGNGFVGDSQKICKILEMDLWEIHKTLVWIHKTLEMDLWGIHRRFARFWKWICGGFKEDLQDFGNGFAGDL